MKWYQKSWGIILILIVFFPIGIYLMWRYAKWNKIIKSVITGIFALMVIGSVSTPEQESSTSNYAAVDTTATGQATFTPEPTEPSIPPTEKPTESPSPMPEPTSNPTEKPTPEPTFTEIPTPTPTLSPTIEPTTELAGNSIEDNVNSVNNEHSGNAGNNVDSGSGDGSNFNTYNNTEQQNTEDTWVLNTSSMKIHYPSCKSVSKIAPQNYATSSESLDDLKAKKYTTCGNCFK